VIRLPPTTYDGTCAPNPNPNFLNRQTAKNAMFAKAQRRNRNTVPDEREIGATRRVVHW